MKFFTPILAGASLVAAVTLQQYFPACSIDCLTTAIGGATTCKTDDGVCICIFDNYVSIVDAATNCVIQACGPDDAVNKVLPAAADYCVAVTSSAGLATNTGSSTARSSTSSGTAATTTPTNSAATTTTAASTTSTGAAANTAATTTSRSTSTPNAAAATGAPGALVAMLAVGAALL